MTLIIFQIIFFVVGITATVVGIKKLDPLILGKGIFLLIAMLILEIFHIRNQIKELYEINKKDDKETRSTR